MRIYKMTATFGKLAHETLTLEPGLNVISAPNEWGKSTWCAFLVNMLYGIDTRARASAGTVPDKERYAPWSGAPMSGSMEIHWNGRDITIERTSNARTPLGVFRAYETHTGLDVPELTAANCGQMLLGVERSVFAQSGFIRLADLPVVQDDALRRRLNSLVTTGDESGTADRLGQTLRELKNKCRSNKANGLIPEAEARREELRRQLEGLQSLQQRTESLQTRHGELEQQILDLENHKQALEYARYMEDVQKLQKAEETVAEAKNRQQMLEGEVRQLPEGGEDRLLEQIEQLLQTQLRLRVSRDTLPQMPQKPEENTLFGGLTPQQAVEKVQTDLQQRKHLLEKKKRTGILAFTLAAVLLAGAAAFLSVSYVPGGVMAAAAILCLGWGIAGRNSCNRKISTLSAAYPGILPENWLAEAQEYARQNAAYEYALQEYESRIQSLEAQEQELQEKITRIAGEKTLLQKKTQLEQAQRLRKDLEGAIQESRRAEALIQTLAEMTQPVDPPQAPDTLRYSYSQTEEILRSAQFEMRQVQLKIAECEGQRQLQGHEAQLRKDLEKEKARILQLESYYDAIELAQTALSKASASLQRRFAPKITKRTQALFKAMTGDRYTKVVMAENMNLSIATAQEDAVRDAQRRSDGTVDQLYLALRLAVAEELTPRAPVVLDDALVRFDDARLMQAMEILEKTAEEKQVILFTCQNREAEYQRSKL